MCLSTAYRQTGITTFKNNMQEKCYKAFGDQEMGLGSKLK